MKRLLGYLMLGIMILCANNVAIARNEKDRKAPAIIYEQSFVTKTGVIDSGAFFSNIEGQLAADQFTLPVGVTITGINWYGIYCKADLESNVMSIDFVVSFYRDRKGLPGEEIYHKTVSAKVLDTEQRITEQGFYNGRKIYKFIADSISLSVKANETIWISVAEIQHRDLRSLKDNGWIWQWLWCFSSSKDSDIKAYAGKERGWQLSTVFGQLAFSLSGFEGRK